MVKVYTKRKRIKALVDSQADESYLYWKMAERLGIRPRKKQNPYTLCRIGGNETLYNKSLVIQETGPVFIQFNRQKHKESFDITYLGEH